MRRNLLVLGASCSLALSIRIGSFSFTKSDTTGSLDDPERISVHLIKANKAVKTIHFVRHAQGHHNVAGAINRLNYMKEEYMDAELTDFGINQCQDFSKGSGNKFDNAELLVVSPLYRTMQTATFCFPSLMNKIPWIANENLREQSGLHPCDKRRNISEHNGRFSHVDFKTIEDADPVYHRYIMREPQEHVIGRCREFFKWLSDRPEKEIIVVTHAAYLRTMFTSVLAVGNENNHKRHYDNCECRTYIISLDPPVKEQEINEQEIKEQEISVSSP